MIMVVVEIKMVIVHQLQYFYQLHWAMIMVASGRHEDDDDSGIAPIIPVTLTTLPAS